MGIFIQYFHQEDTKIKNNAYQNMIWEITFATIDNNLQYGGF